MQSPRLRLAWAGANRDWRAGREIETATIASASESQHVHDDERYAPCAGHLATAPTFPTATCDAISKHIDERVARGGRLRFVLDTRRRIRRQSGESSEPAAQPAVQPAKGSDGADGGSAVAGGTGAQSSC